MEKALRKLAKQLDVYDEASLSALWDILSERVANFEPTKEWEEGVLMLGMVQALRWKNQLFNFNWSENLRANSLGKKTGQENPWPEFNIEGAPLNEEAKALCPEGKKKCKVLSFEAMKDDNTV